MPAVNHPRISEFFVFAPSLCEKEGEEQNKILYYFPSSASSNTQLNSAGLCEAVNAFTSFFQSTCLSVQTLYTKRVIRSMSEGVWVVMVVALQSNESAKESPGSSVTDNVIESVLSTASQVFELFNGKVQAIIDEGGFESLKLRMKHFFPRYLPTINFEHCDLLDCFDGMNFIAVEPSDYAKVHGFLSRLRYSFSCVQHLAFFYHGFLLQSTLDVSYTRNIFFYINSFLHSDLPNVCHSAATTDVKHLGRFLIGPQDFSNPTQLIQCPVLCSPGSPLPDCQLVCYQALHTVVCLLVQGTDPIPMNFFVQLDMMFGPRMTMLINRLAANHSPLYLNALSGAFPVFPIEEMLRQPQPVAVSALGCSPGGARETTSGAGEELVPHAFELSTVDSGYASVAIPDHPLLASSQEHQTYLAYSNRLPRSLTTTLHVNTGSGRRPIPGARHVLDAMASLRQEILQLGSELFYTEIAVELDDGKWIMVQHSNGRELYMLFIDKHDFLRMIDRYAEQIHNTVFKGMLIL